MIEFFFRSSAKSNKTLVFPYKRNARGTVRGHRSIFFRTNNEHHLIIYVRSARQTRSLIIRITRLLDCRSLAGAVLCGKNKKKNCAQRSPRPPRRCLEAQTAAHRVRHSIVISRFLESSNARALVQAIRRPSWHREYV